MTDYGVGDEPVPGYRILRPLGTGQRGSMWIAKKTSGNEEIAVRVIHLRGQGLKEFRAISLLKRLRHPNLLPVLGVWLKDADGALIGKAAEQGDLHGQTCEVVIAYKLGEKSLAGRLHECKQAFAERHKLPDMKASLVARLKELAGSDLAGLPVAELLDNVSGAAQAIDFLNQQVHSLGDGPPVAIQHCGISPNNLLVVANEVQVCEPPPVWLTGGPADSGTEGASPYIAPEMIVGKPGSGTDQYSLAITYYELRTGRLPLDAGAAFQAHVLGQLDFGLVLPAEQMVLRRATHMRPDQRYPTAMEMVRALRAANGQVEAPAVDAKPQSLKDMIRAGVELVPGHTLVQLIGRGTYSEVWAATKAGKTRCAMKIVHNLEAVPGLQELKSLDMIRNLDHDRLIRLQSYWFMAANGSIIKDERIGKPGTLPASALVVATELAQQNLLQRWKEYREQGHDGIPLSELLPYMHQSAEALDHLNFHKPSILHRDVKPEHILLTRNMQVKVGGFGLAKLVKGASATINWASVGLTLAYAAPELFKNTVTRWTDQYSLALTYYRLRTGRLPFKDGIGPIQVMQAHISGALTFSGLEAKEQAVLKRASDVLPRARYASCAEFVEALRAAVGAAPQADQTMAPPATNEIATPAVEPKPDARAAPRPSEVPSQVMVPTLPRSTAAAPAPVSNEARPAPQPEDRRAEFESFRTRHSRDVFALIEARVVATPVAQEIFQKAFEQLWAKWKTGEAIPDPLTWVMQAARKLTSDAARRTLRHDEPGPGDGYGPGKKDSAKPVPGTNFDFELPPQREAAQRQSNGDRSKVIDATPRHSPPLADMGLWPDTSDDIAVPPLANADAKRHVKDRRWRTPVLVGFIAVMLGAAALISIWGKWTDWKFTR